MFRKLDLFLSSGINKKGKDPTQVSLLDKLSSVISNMFMENFEMAALEQTDFRREIWLRIVDDIHHMDI